MKKRIWILVAVLLVVLVVAGVVYFNWPREPEMTFDEYWDSLGETFFLDLIPTFVTIDDQIAVYDLITETGTAPACYGRTDPDSETSRQASRLLESYAGEVYQKDANWIKPVITDPETTGPTYRISTGTWYYPEGRARPSFSFWNGRASTRCGDFPISRRRRNPSAFPMIWWPRRSPMRRSTQIPDFPHGSAKSRKGCLPLRLCHIPSTSSTATMIHISVSSDSSSRKYRTTSRTSVSIFSCGRWIFPSSLPSREESRPPPDDEAPCSGGSVGCGRSARWGSDSGTGSISSIY